MEVKGNKLYWAKVKPNAIIPIKEKENAGYDIYSCFNDDYIIIRPLHTKLIPTGIACAVRDSYYLQVQERGSTGSIGMKYGSGVIDSGYRGEIFVTITNTNEVPIMIVREADRNMTEIYDIINETNAIVYPYEKAIAQLVVHRVLDMEEQEISYEELKSIPSKRGDGMLGSSGK